MYARTNLCSGFHGSLTLCESGSKTCGVGGSPAHLVPVRAPRSVHSGRCPGLTCCTGVSSYLCSYRVSLFSVIVSPPVQVSLLSFVLAVCLWFLSLSRLLYRSHFFPLFLPCVFVSLSLSRLLYRFLFFPLFLPCVFVFCLCLPCCTGSISFLCSYRVSLFSLFVSPPVQVSLLSFVLVVCLCFSVFVSSLVQVSLLSFVLSVFVSLSLLLSLTLCCRLTFFHLLFLSLFISFKCISINHYRSYLEGSIFVRFILWH